ncbi:MAG: hypothetical protein AABY11_01745 [archaeon]
MHPRLTIVHDPDLDEIDRAFVEETLVRTLEKVDLHLHGEHRLKAVYKQSNKDGLRRKTEVHLSLEGSGRSFRAVSSDWKVRLATTEACKTLEGEVDRSHRHE